MAYADLNKSIHFKQWNKNHISSPKWKLSSVVPRHNCFLGLVKTRGGKNQKWKKLASLPGGVANVRYRAR